MLKFSWFYWLVIFADLIVFLEKYNIKVGNYASIISLVLIFIRLEYQDEADKTWMYWLEPIVMFILVIMIANIMGLVSLLTFIMYKLLKRIGGLGKYESMENNEATISE